MAKVMVTFVFDMVEEESCWRSVKMDIVVSPGVKCRWTKP